VTHLPWLSPCADSLVALTRSPAGAVWEEVRGDPGCVFLIVRQAAGVLSSPAVSFFPALLSQPGILDEALRHLDQSVAGFVDWNQPAAQPVYHACLTYARWAHCLADRTGRCEPDNAWVAGLSAGLGWLAVCAVAPEQVLACLADPIFPADPAAVQRRVWGLDHAAIARRLVRRWRLPSWLAVSAGQLGLTTATAQAVGADPELFRIVQLAVLLAQRPAIGLGLAVGSDLAETAAALRLPAVELKAVEREVEAWHDSSPRRLAWTAPESVPLLRDLIALAAQNRRLVDAPVLSRLESDVDLLHRALESHRTGEAERLQAMKLNALAELAAGAGHEINNPLAVISGQAQYLLKKVGSGQWAVGGREPKTCEVEARGAGEGSMPTEPPVTAGPRPNELSTACQTIIRQAQRIHELINELMQFARPSRPQRQLTDLGLLVREVATSLSDYAAERRVRLVCQEPESLARVNADPRHLRTILNCLLRNAIEAAARSETAESKAEKSSSDGVSDLAGWAGIRLDTTRPDRLNLVVEDSGPGPSLDQREHLFDPFYSGRYAGRGRGLGLSTAWRLAREHGGDVYFEALATGPTRFVVSLPREAPVTEVLTSTLPLVADGMAG
jgi:signal transduction histidine kinase